MKETLKMMRSIITGKESEKSDMELIKEYKERLSPNILAYFYINNFGLIEGISRFYPVLLDEDKASFCLQELDKCLQNFEFNQSKFSTYFYRCYKNRLYVEYNKHKALKNKIESNWYYLEDTEVDRTKTFIELEDNTIIEDWNITKEEKYQCKLLNFGYTIKEIANILGLSEQSVYYRNHKIKEKLLASF